MYYGLKILGIGGGATSIWTHTDCGRSVCLLRTTERGEGTMAEAGHQILIYAKEELEELTVRLEKR